MNVTRYYVNGSVDISNILIIAECDRLPDPRRTARDRRCGLVERYKIDSGSHFTLYQFHYTQGKSHPLNFEPSLL